METDARALEQLAAHLSRLLSCSSDAHSDEDTESLSTSTTLADTDLVDVETRSGFHRHSSTPDEQLAQLLLTATNTLIEVPL